MNTPRRVTRRLALILAALATPLCLCAIAFLYMWFTHITPRVIKLNTLQCDNFVAEYFPTAITDQAATDRTAYFSLDGPLTLKVKGPNGECTIPCSDISLIRDSHNKQDLHCGAVELLNDEAMELALKFCRAVGLSSDELTKWYANRGKETLEPPSCFESGVVDGHSCTIEVRGRVIHTTLYMYISFSLDQNAVRTERQ